jgi:hypothetical protein
MSSQKHNAVEKRKPRRRRPVVELSRRFGYIWETASQRLLQPLEFDDTKPAIT